MNYYLKVYSALIPRLFIKLLCDITIFLALWIQLLEIGIKERYNTYGRISWFIVQNINQPLTKLHNYFWGKDGVWHNYYEIEHWHPFWQ